LLSPVTTVPGVVIDVPANEGAAIMDPNLLPGLNVGFPSPCCAPFQFVDVNWLDTYINGTLLPQLRSQGVSPATLPVFVLYNAEMFCNYQGLDSLLLSLCTNGFHHFSGQPIPTQTYAVTVFDTSGFYFADFEDTAIASHEFAEWANDPFGVNLV